MDSRLDSRPREYMQCAIVKNNRAEPIPGGRGHCPTCDSIMIAKCGPRVLHHWAHEGRRNCDPWWENETQWHRDWKNCFPEQCREVHHRAHGGEIHRADVKTPTGICIEIQHSSMPDTERLAREDFYGNLLWIVDGRAFRERFHILHRLPDPNAPIAEDIVWFPPHPNWRGDCTGLFYRLSETRESYPETTITKANVGSIGGMVQVHSLADIRDEVLAAYVGHRQYYWVRLRKAWLESPSAAFLDFGDDWVAKLDTYDDYGLPCIRVLTKRRLVRDAMSFADVGLIGKG